ncbi:hypothetical protein GCM10010254_02270 [Streptomyces chromofuscus]|nr:hypothetical protein GCM10010254_02270 [Streptomyces chromofuscus]
MRKRMLRSVLVAAFSAVVAVGTLSGLSPAKDAAPADSIWSQGAVSAEPVGEDTRLGTDDSIWS